MKKIVITLMLIVALVGAVSAQVPRGFNFQMVVRNNNGQLVSDRMVSLNLSIHQGSPTGTQVYQLMARPTTNTNGLITVVVGSGSDSASYDAINWGTGPYYIVCEVDPSGGNNYALRTEQQILSVPYATYATTADHVSQSFSYDERDPKFSSWAYDYDSLVGAPSRLSDFINDLDLLDTTDIALTLSGNSLCINGSNCVTLPLTTSLLWDSIVNHPTQLSQFVNDLGLLTASDLSLSVSGNSLCINNASCVNLPLTTSLQWDSIVNRPTQLSQFVNDLGLLTASDLMLSVSGDNLCINGVSCVSLPRTTSIQWDSVINRPTQLSDLDNNLTFHLSGDTLFFGDNWIVMPGNSGFVINWTDVVGRPTNLSEFFNDRGFITTESQTLANVLALGNDASNYQIHGLGDPTSANDAANKHYIDDAFAAERALYNNRIDSLNAVITGLRASYDSIKTTMGGSLDSLINNLYEYQHRAVPGELPGVFSVSDNVRVRFSSGNLQYRLRTKVWRFAPSQDSFVGTDNNNISNSYYSGWIDLFGYGTSGWDGGSTTHGLPTSTSTNASEYTESTDGDDLVGMYAFADWGVFNPIINGGNQVGLWRTLSYNEWSYLISDRANATLLRGMATVGSSQGYILLPDNWQLPAGLTFTPGATDYTTNVYNAEQWTQMENAGAVFLPSAGFRTASSTSQDNVEGHYWTTSHVNGTLANSIKIAIGAGASSQNSNCSNGHAVRLVREY